MEIYKLIDGKPIKVIDYSQIREIALQNGIDDNKVSIGMWAKMNGYIKTNKQINGKVTVTYYKL